MSRVLPFNGSLPSSIAEGTRVQIPFLAFQRPLGGTGTLALNMRKSTSTDLQAIVRLLQAGRVLGTMVVSPTTSNADYTLNLTSTQILSLIPPGSCNVDDTVIEIEPVASVPSTCCASVGFPTTLYATISAPAGPLQTPCTAIDGKVATLSYIGKLGTMYTWTGTVDAGACGTLTVRFTVAEESPGASCDQYMEIRNSSDQVCFGLIHNGPQCPIVSVIFGIGTWNNTNCGCCNSPQNNGSITVTVTP